MEAHLKLLDETNNRIFNILFNRQPVTPEDTALYKELKTELLKFVTSKEYCDHLRTLNNTIMRDSKVYPIASPMSIEIAENYHSANRSIYDAYSVDFQRFLNSIIRNWATISPDFYMSGIHVAYILMEECINFPVPEPINKLRMKINYEDGSIEYNT